MEIAHSLWRDLIERLDIIDVRLSSISRQLQIVTHGGINVATQAELDALNTQVTANTNATAAVAQALQGFVKTVADLTAQLQAAVAAGDSAAIVAATAALAANNTALTAAIPATAAAVIVNTPAAT